MTIHDVRPGRRRHSPWVGAAILLGRIAAVASRLAGRGGTALPGLIAERVAPHALAHLAAQVPRGVVMVTGTNGKTTTSHMVHALLSAAGWPVIHNASGSNLPRGILATLLARAAVTGALRVAPGTIAVLEVDEAAVPAVLAATGASVLVVTNLFRDQLDRYGEVDAVRDRWRAALEALPPGRRPTLVLNVDDPGVAGLARVAGPAGTVAFGVDDPKIGRALPDHAADARTCPECGGRLDHAWVTYGHLGDWRCPAGHRRPPLAVAAREVTGGAARISFTLATPDGSVPVHLQVPGTYNAYNAIAAAGAGLSLGIPLATISDALGSFRGTFGRFERVAVGDRVVLLVLAKNPVGMNEALRAVSQDAGASDLLLALNDLDADGRDVSWVWDADFEVIAPHARRVTVSGRRAPDLALRLSYAGIGAPGDPGTTRVVVEELGAALDHALAGARPGGTVAAVTTYTAMLALRAVLVARGLALPFWEDAGGSRSPADQPPSTPAGRDARGPSPARATPAGDQPPPSIPPPLRREREAPPPTGARRVRVGHLYADLLNLYADRGNVVTLRRRCEWRGIDFDVVALGIGDRVAPDMYDLLFMGGGQDGDQAFLADDLFRMKADGLRGAVADGVPLLAVCGSYQLLGHHYDPASGPRLAGLGIFDVHTVHPGPVARRCIGNVVAEWPGAPEGAPRTLVGFENHGGRTWLGPGATPLARIITGHGNNGEDRTEGIVVANAIGTYLHGSLLPKNPHLADRLIAMALDRSGATALEPLDDEVEWRAHESVLARHAAGRRGTRGGAK